ncbi:HpcH/HpaI aldolase/citrate lyase family protein [Allosediminivita pacifica]|uniref:Citrate lyase subunit beta/citryl-CoA lyase n=1 Tax=Allosediminivita pacifica TaxID=1267769 RepID=A0A2T6A7H6_9RHOB|nr:aldolase/citrate lyase family protein [Allosediminivita pacifica]PTX39791.1 citrate lyase subunit beta/citryl-CoA lyase [Allosediminivita pacifica]GGB27183.1 citrate lyase subunit beta-like protein [Allosediminivita pacifica]
MTSIRETFGTLRSILEVPLKTDRFWPKIPGSTADAIMLDLEDSVPAAQKDAARTRAVRICNDPALIAGKHMFIRVNGHQSGLLDQDLAAVAACPPEVMICYPKIEHEDEISRMTAQLLQHGGPARRIYVMVESPRGVSQLDAILSRPEVVGVHFGYTDYASEVGCALFDDEGSDFRGIAMKMPRARIAAAAAEHDVFATGGSLIPAFRDTERVAAFLRAWRDDGYTGSIAMIPSHVPLIHDNIRHTAPEIAEARDRLDNADQAEVPFIARKLAELILRQHRGY